MLSKKEKEFCDFMYESDQSITKDSIYKKIINTPDNLLESLEEEHPEECAIFRRYSYEAGYWDNLRDEFDKIHLLRG